MEDEMGKTCNTHEINEKSIQNIFRIRVKTRLLRKPKYRLEDNNETEREIADYIHLAHEDVHGGIL
jgi:hypothetical protein